MVGNTSFLRILGIIFFDVLFRYNCCVLARQKARPVLGLGSNVGSECETVLKPLRIPNCLAHCCNNVGNSNPPNSVCNCWKQSRFTVDGSLDDTLKLTLLKADGNTVPINLEELRMTHVTHRLPPKVPAATNSPMARLTAEKDRLAVAKADSEKSLNATVANLEARLKAAEEALREKAPKRARGN